MKNWKNFEACKYDEQLYIFCFLKMVPESFTVNSKDLEKYYFKIRKKNKRTKAEEMKEILEDLRDSLSTINQDPDRSMHFESKVKIKDGVQYNEGSVEELIHNLISFTNKEGGKEKFLEIFEKYMDAQNEVDESGLEKVLNDAELKNSSQQRTQLLKLMDSDKDVMLSYDELKKYIENYNPEISMTSNMLAKGGGKKGMLS